MAVDIVDLKEIAARTGWKLSTIYHQWRGWKVKVLKPTPQSRSPRFHWSDIEKMLSQPK